jgi:hypothetical protein
MKTEIVNYTDHSIFELENFVWVQFDHMKANGELITTDYVTVPVAKYTKHVSYFEETEGREGLCSIEYIDDTDFKETKDEELWTSDKIGEYSYCLGDCGFVSNVEFKENE